MISSITLRRALQDRNLLGDMLGGESWFAWRTLLLAAMGEALVPDELAVFTAADCPHASTAATCRGICWCDWSPWRQEPRHLSAGDVYCRSM